MVGVMKSDVDAAKAEMGLVDDDLPVFAADLQTGLDVEADVGS